MNAIPLLPYRFRPIIEADLEKVVAIEEDAHISPWTKGIFRDCLRVNYTCHLVECNEDIIAYSIMNVAVGEAHLFNICVNNNYKRRGYGRILLQHMIDVARDKQAKSMFLEVRPSNTTAIALYEDSGFGEVGCRNNYYPVRDGRREDALIFARDI